MRIGFKSNKAAGSGCASPAGLKRLGDEGQEQVAENTVNNGVSSEVVPPVVPWGVEWDEASAELAAIWIDLGETERKDLLAVARGLAGKKASVRS